MRKRHDSKSRVSRAIRTNEKTGAVDRRRCVADVERGLATAFVTFTQAASSLERSYTQLHGEVVRLHGELARANAELDRSLEENSRVRAHLAQVLENLPCGVVVVDGAAQKVQLMNPQARALLEIPADWNEGRDKSRPPLLEKLLAHRLNEENGSEQEWALGDSASSSTLGALGATVAGKESNAGDRVWIVRDLTEQKRAAIERERAQQSLALAEMTTILAHEIRNPLGSMELFTGLLEEAVATTPETRQWINHLRAGLRSLSATLTNVVDVYINYLRRKIDSGSERPLIRTVRGVGYQIGGNHVASREPVVNSRQPFAVSR